MTQTSNKHIFLLLGPIKELLQKVQSNKDIVICGLSIKVQNIILSTNKSIKYVFDNNKKLHNTKFKETHIISLNELKKLSNIIIIIPKSPYSHIFLNQIHEHKIKYDIYIESFIYFYQYLFKNIQILIEIPFFKPIYGTNIALYHIFPNILKYILLSNINIKTTSISHENKNYFKNREIQNNQFLFSYHSVGKAKFNIIRIKEGYFANTAFYDTKGYSGFSSKIYKKDVQKNSLIKAEKDFKFYANKYIKNNLSKYLQPKQTDIKLPKNFVFFAMQVVGDSVEKLGYVSQIKLLQHLIKIFDKNKISLVIKKHPKCQNKQIIQALENLKNHQNIHVIDASIHTLISNAKAVYTVNSGVGFEALLHLKPVVLFGKSDYESACFICKDLDKLQIVPKLTAKKKEYIKKFISYYMEERNFLIDDEKKIKKVIDKALANFFIYHLQKEYKCKVKIYT